MERRVGFCLGVALLLAVSISLCAGQTEQKYFKIGGKLKLSPAPVSGPIIGVVWKFGQDLLAEWVKEVPSVEYYPKIKGRSEVNINTGVLEIWNLTEADIGLYSVEINNQVQSEKHEVKVIEDVPKPKVDVKPLACSAKTHTNCTLLCEGTNKIAQPITYSWKMGEGEFEDGEERKVIFNDEKTRKVKTFTCRMKNPLGDSVSDPFDNVFYQEKPDPKYPPGDNVGAIVGVIVGVIVLTVVCFFVYLRFCNKERYDLIMKRLPCMKSHENPPTNDPSELGKLNVTQSAPSPADGPTNNGQTS